ncbi:hypothetical protein [Microbacterium esteraromaticum]|uniref:hypothetical protein n=1 Tax=Microbacterium esteraromaticum TaxID=57043 RepID=UPI001C97C003|nr:hypothetical protein [Microbacterium esteraromaticum]MBY6062169.1 hypothetical protein [Microbacterium esteraromaticum]
MVAEERAAWAGLISLVLTIPVYVVVLVGASDPTASWLLIMLWTIGAGIVLTVLIIAVWALIARAREGDAVAATDIRDRDISRMGTRVEHAFLVIAGLGVIALCAVNADVFWIAQTMFAGFAVSAFVGGIARVIAYRRGLI